MYTIFTCTWKNIVLFLYVILRVIKPNRDVGEKGGNWFRWVFGWGYTDTKMINGARCFLCLIKEDFKLKKTTLYAQACL